MLCIAIVLATFGYTRVSAQTAVAVSSSASAAVLYEPLSGRVLYEKNAHDKRPMASTTKLMTALLAAERLAPGAVLTATEEAVPVEGTDIGLRVGDRMTRDDLLYGLLLASGNDAANVLALSMADSYEAFAALMNERANALGMTKSHFVTPSGLDADGHGASAYDMALLAAAVLENETLAAVCATSSATVSVGGREQILHNHNRLLTQYPDCIGMKTGYTSQSGRCLVSAAKRDGVTLIAVTLNCPNDWEEHRLLLDEGFACMTAVTVSPPSLPPWTVYGGTKHTVALQSDAVTVTVCATDEQQIETAVVLPPYGWAPLTAGETVGWVEYRLRGTLLATAPIQTTAAVPAEPRAPYWLRVRRLFTALLEEAWT